MMAATHLRGLRCGSPGTGRRCALGATLGTSALLLSACGTTPGPRPQDAEHKPPIDLASVPDAVPRVEPPCRYGNPDAYEVDNQRYAVMPSSRGYVERGLASWYGREFHNRYTSCREPYDMFAMTAAHRSLPLPTYVQVTNLLNGRRIVVRVNDRGPFRDHRIIDLSYVAAYKLGALGPGTIPVEVRALDPGVPLPAQPSLLLAGAGAVSRRELPPARLVPAAATYFQVGAFAALENAERLREQLLDGGVQPVFIEPSGALYRVRVGPLADRSAAERIQQQLSYLGLGKPHIIP